jgi:hypothetical protein
MKKLFFIVLLLLVSYTSVGNAENMLPVYVQPTQVESKYSLEVMTLASKVSALKGKYCLEYKDDADLLDTCSKIVKHCTYEPVFNKWDIASIVIKESKFNHRAYNKREHVAGLMQITKPHKYWKNELIWYTNPYDKDQNIKAGLVVLKTFYNKHKEKKLAIKHYNGSTDRSDKYADSIMTIKHDLISVKI